LVLNASPQSYGIDKKVIDIIKPEPISRAKFRDTRSTNSNLRGVELNFSCLNLVLGRKTVVGDFF
jgi:hypothetical protein